jgi:hypothetical protein
MDNTAPWPPDPARGPQKLELEISSELAAWLARQAEQTGRSEEELILELLDKGLQNF